jgi:hypothetical protein
MPKRKRNCFVSLQQSRSVPRGLRADGKKEKKWSSLEGGKNTTD